MVMTLEVGLIAAAAGVVPVGLLTWQAVATRRALSALESRLARQADALTLLTETSETGFAAVAQELARRTAVPAPQRPPAARRVAVAAKRGKSITDIADAERMSEGEVHLRLQLAARQAEADRLARKR
jgi:hypothetical protein